MSGDVTKELESLKNEIAELKRFFVEDLKDIIQEELKRCLEEHDKDPSSVIKQGPRNEKSTSQEGNTGGENEISVKEEPMDDVDDTESEEDES